MFITGPEVIKTVTGEEVDFEELGGAMTHNTKSGVAHFASDDEDACLEDTRYLLSFLPQNNLETPPRVQPTDDPLTAGPGARPRRPRQPQQALRHARRRPPRRRRRRVLRGPRALRAQHHVRLLAPGRLRGRRSSATSPIQLAGVLDIDSSEKAARFVRTCDAFNIPIITFCDVPGFLPGHRPGVGRDHPPRRQAAVRLRRGDGPEDHDHHPQGLRRRLRRHGLKAPRGGLQLRLADGRGRGDGPRGRGQHHLPP